MAEKIREFQPETIPEFDLKEDKIPWLTEDKLDASISIRWIKDSLPYIDTFTRLTTNWTTWSYTWVWFKPRMVVIEAVRSPNAVDPIFCICSTKEDWAWWFTYAELYKDNVNKSYIYNSAALRVADQPWTPWSIWTIATMQSFDDDGFTLSFSDRDWNVEVKVTCYP